MVVRCRINDRSPHAIEALERRLQLSGTPQLVLDIHPGSGDSSPAELVNAGGALFFAANNGTTGPELWKSNGTAAGTQLVKEITPGFSGSRITEITDVNGIAYFSALNGGGDPYGLWRSDGTSEGTTLLKAMTAAPRQIINVNGTLFFFGNDGISGYELWKSDGTPGGTVLVEDIRLGGAGSTADPNRSSMVAVGNRAFLSAYSAGVGYEIWVSDGTEDGTTLVEEVIPGDNVTPWPFELTASNGKVMFGVQQGPIGELWTSDGTADGTFLVKGLGVQRLADVNGTLFFSAHESSFDLELWKSDGTPGGTQLVKDINPGPGGSDPMHITEVNGRAFFAAAGGLWVSDGTAQGTQLVRGSLTITASDEFIDVNGTLFFTANTTLWTSDGTEAGTTDYFGTVGLIEDLTNVNGTLFFSGEGSIQIGRELWKLDATSDTIAPTVTSSAFEFETAHEIVIRFSENVSASLSANDLQVVTLPGGPTITPSGVAYNAATNTATFAIAPRLGDGDYRATLPAGSVSDAAGNPLAQDHTLDFAFLNGDANRDGRVNLQDFNILAINFGTSGRTFSQGNFNYDPAGLVNLQDFNLLASRFGTALAPLGTFSSNSAGEADERDLRDLTG